MQLEVSSTRVRIGLRWLVTKVSPTPAASFMNEARLASIDIHSVRSRALNAQASTTCVPWVLTTLMCWPELTERPDDETVGRIPADDRRRAPSPRLEPEPVGAVHVHEHRAQIRLAELPADLTAGSLVPERGDHAEEPAIRPVVVRPVFADQVDGH